MYPPRPVLASTRAGFVLYIALVLTGAMVLFPPFTSLGGTEYAFVLIGPAWSRAMGPVGAELGLEARIHWPLLLAQAAAVWAVALGVRRLLTASSERVK